LSELFIGGADKYWVGGSLPNLFGPEGSICECDAGHWISPV